MLSSSPLLSVVPKVDVRRVEFVSSSTLELPQRVRLLTPGGAKGRGSRRMFWELAPGDVIGKPVKSQCPKVINAWKRRKPKMEKGSREPWTEFEHNPRAVQLRAYTLKTDPLKRIQLFNQKQFSPTL